MRSTTAAHFFLLSAFVLLTLGQAQAATEADSASVLKIYDQSDVVFTGELESKAADVATFRIGQAIKGVKRGKQTMRVRFLVDGPCIAGPEESLNLVYAFYSGAELTCADIKHISKAQSDLKYLHQINPKAEPSCTNKEFRRLARRSDVVATANVSEVQEHTIAFWSGPLQSSSNVTYDLREILKGAVDHQQIVVEHMIYHNALTSDIEIPQLSPMLFAQGETLLLFLRPHVASAEMSEKIEVPEGFVALDADWKTPDYEDVDVNCGAVVVDDATVQFVRDVIAGKEGTRKH